MFEAYHRMYRLFYCALRRKSQNRKESKQLRQLYVGMIKETKEKHLDLHQNKFKGIRKQKPVITRKVIK